MKRKLLAAVAVAAAGVVLAVAAVRSAAEKDADKKPAGRFVHTVIFTLKKDAPKDEEAQMIADCHEMLGKIPSVKQLRAGRPSEKGTPRLAKKDYSVALSIVFDDADGLAAYDKSEQHQEFVKKHLAHVDLEKLLVYDFEDQAK
ncbi:MAG TPA: Dabb family protein [Gemmataceae bacterium]|nr:Dabb family protein [Gemmataceae bacterium]